MLYAKFLPVKAVHIVFKYVVNYKPRLRGGDRKNVLPLITSYSVVLVQRTYPLRERLRTHKVFTKDQYFYINCHEFSIKSYVLDVY